MLSRFIYSLIVGFFLSSMPSWAQNVRFPSNPSSSNECEAAHNQAQQLAQQYHERAVQTSNLRADVARQRQQSCSGYAGNNANQYWRCVEPYDRKQSELYPLITRDFAERDRIKREAHGPYMACKQTARLNEERLAQQRDGERRNREAYQRNLEQNMAARQREQMEREREMEQSRQARVIASTPAPSYNNQPRIVQTPQYQAQQQAQQQAQAEQSRQQQRVQEAQALSDAFKNLRQAYKQGQQTGATNAAGTSAAMAETNAAVNAGRGGSPVAGAIGGAALAATGGRNAQTMNTLDSTLKQMDQVGANTSSGTTVASNNYRQPSSAMPAANHPSGDSNATAGASPETACGNRVFLALQRCMVKQCELPQFANHPQCKNMGSSASSGNTSNTSNSASTVDSSNNAVANNNYRPPVSVTPAAANPPVNHATAGTATASSPEEACGKRVLLALQRCVVKQCESPQFAGHPQCKNFSSTSAPASNAN